MSVICHHFVQNAWRKDLCSNCFKSEEEHPGGGAPLSGSGAARAADVLVGLDQLTRRYSGVQGRPGSYNGGSALTDLLGRPGSSSRGGSLALKSTALLRGLQSPPRHSSEPPDMKQLTDSGGAGRLTSSRLVQMADHASSGSALQMADHGSGGGVVESDSSQGQSRDVEEVAAAVNRTLVAGLRGILVLDSSGRTRRKRTITFSEHAEVIGYGGDVAEEVASSSDEDQAATETADTSDVLTAAERQLWNLTKRNTDFNSIASNLSGTSRTLVDWVDENDRTTERSALTGRHKKFTPLVSIAPFSSVRSPGGVKVNLVAPMKNGQVVTESRREMVERREEGSANGDSKMAEKITRLDDLIDDKPRKTTSVEIGSDGPHSVAETVSVIEFPGSTGDPAISNKVETRLSFSIGGRRSETAVNGDGTLPRSEGPSSLPADLQPDTNPTKTASSPSKPTSTRRTSPQLVRKQLESTAESREPDWSVSDVPNQAPSPVTRTSLSGRKLASARVEAPPKPSDEVEQDVGDSPDNYFASISDSITGTDSKGRELKDKSSLSFDNEDVSMNKHRETDTHCHSVEQENEHNSSLDKRRDGSLHITEPRYTTLTSLSTSSDENGRNDATEEPAEQLRASARSSALQKLIDKDVDNQDKSVHFSSSSVQHSKEVQAKKSETKFGAITSPFPDKTFRSHDSASKVMTEANMSETLNPIRPADNSITANFAAPVISYRTEAKARAPAASDFAKPSPRASFLHSLTSSRDEVCNDSYSAFLSTSSGLNEAKPIEKNTVAEPSSSATRDEAPALPSPAIKNDRLTKPTHHVIRAASKPSGGSPKPPILREKPKIAAKPAKLHRLSRTVSTDSESSDRAQSEPREMTSLVTARDGKSHWRQAASKASDALSQMCAAPSDDSQSENRQQTVEDKVIKGQNSTLIADEHTPPLEDMTVGTVCVEVKSPVLDASTRLTKLVEGVKPAAVEPEGKSHLTISVSPPRPPARKESMTKKEWAMHREKELERQREELEKRHQEDDEPKIENRKLSSETRREHRIAPQPPGHEHVERTVSGDFEANRAAIASLLLMGHRSSTTKRQAPPAPDSSSREETPVKTCPDVNENQSPSPSPPVDPKVRTVDKSPPAERHISEPADEPETREDKETEVEERVEEKESLHSDTAENTEDVNEKGSTENHPEIIVADSVAQLEEKAHESVDHVSDSKSDDADTEPAIESRTHECADTSMSTHSSVTQAKSQSEAVQPASTGGLLEEVAELVGLSLPHKSFAESHKPEDQGPEVDSRITLKVESAVPPPVPINPPAHSARELAGAQARELSSREPPMSLPVSSESDVKFSVKDDTNPYASSAIFERRSSFRPDTTDDDEDEDLPPSASMRASSVSPRSRRKRARNATLVSFDPGAECYSRDTVIPVQPRSQSMPRAGQLTEAVMTEEEVKRKIYGVSSAGTVFGASSSSGERKSRRDEPKRRGKFSLKKLLKFGSSSSGSKEDKKKEKGEHRSKLEIIHPLDLTPGSGKVEVIVRTEEEKKRDEAERQRKKALLIAEGTRVYDTPSFSKGTPVVNRLPERSLPVTTPTATPPGPSAASWHHGALGFNSEGRPKPPPPPRRTSSMDQSEPLTPPSRPAPPAAELFSRTGSGRSSGRADSEYANLGTYRAGLTPRKPDRAGSVRQDSPVAADVATPQLPAAAAASQRCPTDAAEPTAEMTPSPPGQKSAPGSESGLPRQRASRVSLRKQSSVVHANLEENYDAVTASNHEALAQLLDQVSRRRPVPAPLRPLEHNPALAFTHFKVWSESHVTCGRRAFLRATHREQPVLLMLSSEVAAQPAASLPPAAQFRDLVQGHLLPKASTGSYTSAMQATVWVFPPLSVQPVWDLVSNYPAVNSHQQEQEVCLLLLQTVHHLLELQQRGQLFVDQSLCELVAADADGDPHCRLVAIYGNSGGQQKLTSCQAALAVMLRMLGVQDALERVRDGRGVSVPEVPSLNAFELLASLLLRDELPRVRTVLEYLLWGPADLELSGAHGSLQRWLDLERATLLNSLIRTQKLWSVELSVLEEFRLMFLVQTDSAALQDASALLEI